MQKLRTTNKRICKIFNEVCEKEEQLMKSHDGFYHEDTYFSIDSDLVLCLAEIHHIQRFYGKVEYYHINKKYFAARNNFNEIMYLYDLISTGKLKPVITNTVFQEISGSIYATDSGNFDINIIKFFEDFCYAPKPNVLLSNRESDRVQVLAKKYCLPYKDNAKKKHPAPMKFKFNAYFNMMLPENDAVCVAEASEMNLSFLTYNGRHLIWRGKDEDAKVRTLGIVAINIQSGYYTQTPTGSKIVPKPMYLLDFVNSVKVCDGGLNYYDCPLPDTNRLVRLKDLIDLETFKAELKKEDDEIV